MSSPSHILIADDVPDVCRRLAGLLSSRGFRCTTAHDGETALEVLRTQPLDVVVADIVMPGNEHLELVRAARSLAPGLPIILMTGHASLDNAIGAADLSVTGFIVKPFKPEELIARVSRAVHRAPSSAAAQKDAVDVADRREPPAAETPRLSSLVELFLDHYQSRASPRTVASYRIALELLLRYCADRAKTPRAELELEQINPGVVKGFIASLGAERKCSPATCAARTSALRSFFRFAASISPGASSLAEETTYELSQTPQPRRAAVLSRRDLEAIVTSPDRSTEVGRRDAAVLLLLTRTSLNASEIIALDARDVRFEQDGASVEITRKQASSSVRLPGDVECALRAVFDDRARCMASDRPLFVGAGARRLTSDALGDLLHRAVNAASAVRPALSSVRVTIPVLRRSAMAAPTTARSRIAR